MAGDRIPIQKDSLSAGMYERVLPLGSDRLSSMSIGSWMRTRSRIRSS